MNDLISRQAAISAMLEWEESSVWDDECCQHRGEPFWVAPSDVIKKLPTAQPETIYYPQIDGITPSVIVAQPEIIRCKDCKNWGTSWRPEWSNCHHYCSMIDGWCKGDWYCADAERIEDG